MIVAASHERVNAAMACDLSLTLTALMHRLLLLVLLLLALDLPLALIVARMYWSGSHCRVSNLAWFAPFRLRCGGAINMRAFVVPDASTSDSGVGRHEPRSLAALKHQLRERCLRALQRAWICAALLKSDSCQA